MEHVRFSFRNVRLRGIFALLGVLALVITGSVRVVHAAGEIKVGLVVGLTGGASAWGKRAWNTYQMIFDELNEKGGIKSMGGAKINYRVMDHQTKPEIAGNNTERLIRDGARVIFGANSSDNAMVASQVCQRAKIPFIDTTDGDPMITERGFDYVFRVNPHNRMLCTGALKTAQWLETKKKFKKVAILSGQTSFGYSSYKIYEKILPPHYDVVFKETYPVAQQDFTGIVSKMKKAGVEFVFQTANPADAILITRAYKEMDFNPLGYMGTIGGHYVMDYIEALGKDADYTLCSNWFTSDLKVPLIKELMARYKQKYGIEFDATDATVCCAISVLVDALERAGKDDPAKVRDAIKATDLEVGKYWYIIPEGCKFDKNNQNIKQKTVAFQIRDGKWKAVYPEDFSSIKVGFPFPEWGKR
jgi:branched-chain amino acid transport system substrate-binding protein